jgi:hypothetical protein
LGRPPTHPYPYNLNSSPRIHIDVAKGPVCVAAELCRSPWNAADNPLHGERSLLILWGGSMQLKLVACVCVSLFCFGAARGQETKVDLFAGYSHVQANLSENASHGNFGLDGGQVNVAYRAKSWLSAVADVSGYGGRGNVSTYLFGPRFTHSHIGQLTLFSQVLFGVTHASSGVFALGKQNAFTVVIGGGFDYHISRHFSLRPLEFGYLLTDLDEINNARISTGIVFHF